MSNDFDTGEWEIWIDDVDGELAMERADGARRKIQVVEAEVFESLRAELAAEKARTAKLVEALDSIDEISFQNGYHSVSKLSREALADYAKGEGGE